MFSPIFSSADKGSTLYRLAGVVEHIGEGSLKSGHYIAYVRARRLANQQEGSSCSSSWFCADDRQIRQVTLERYAVNVLENNKSYVERLQQGAEWLGQFSPLVDHMLPVPVCSLAANASSRISQAMKAAAVMGRAFKLLRSVIHPPEHFTVLFESAGDRCCYKVE